MSKKSVKLTPISEENSGAENSNKKIKIKPPKNSKQKKHKKVVLIVVIVILILGALGAGGVALYFLVFNKPAAEAPAEQEQAKEPEPPKYYSKLTGLEIASEAENSSPLYCMQIPNGADGARPQTGLDEAGVVFEAIAEAGITRFAAVFQNPKSKTIGPIRSLRSYYLDWDTPFDCAIVHAGGSTDAVAAVRAGGYHDLTESAVYMWRDYTSYWAPNNLMTSPTLLSEFAKDDGYTTATPQTFLRLSEKDVEAAVAKLNLPAEETTAEHTAETNCADGDENTNCASASVPFVPQIAVNFGSVATFNTVYQYDIATNTYRRSYASGEEHLVYNCAAADGEEPSPKKDCGIAKQLAPSAVAVMMVDERLDSDNYHHVIQTIGTGTAYIFQNGTAVKGTWKKASRESQIVFTSDAGEPIAFTPGQLWIAAIPNYGGSVQF
ncbi:DUF3048 domain-containing protein [Candidatus Saccharibacteria bacterium]|nr:DUF3048 domain-containing protein [Candidatus Saccharibacteria bacterium]